MKTNLALFKDFVLGENLSKKIKINGEEILIEFNDIHDCFIDSATGTEIPLATLLHQCGDFQNETEVQNFIEQKLSEFRKNTTITEPDEFADSSTSTGQIQHFDESSVRESIRLLHGDLKKIPVEVRIPNVEGGGVYSGIFNNPEALLNQLRIFCSNHTYRDGIYMTLNTIDLGSTNKIQRASSTVRDTDVNTRRWILIDVDPEKKPGESSTDLEKKAALDVINELSEYLKDNFGISGHIADSGNGYHLLIPVALEESDDTGSTIKAFLDALAEKFDSKGAKVDRGVYNASRGTKLYGTFAKKGNNTDHRPHRQSEFINIAGSPDPIDELGYLKEITAKIKSDLDENMVIDLTKVPYKPSIDYAKALLSFLPTHFGANQGGYETWLKVISAVNDQFSDAETVQLIEEWSPGYPGEVVQKIKHPSRNVKIGFGWLVTLAKSHGFSNTAWENAFVAKEKRSEKSINEKIIKKSDLKMSDELISSLPAMLQEFFELMQQETDAPKEFLLPPFITIFATLIGNKRYVDCVRSIRIYPVFWTILFAGSSSFRKSTAINLAKKQFSVVGNKFEEIYRKEFKVYKAALKEFEKLDVDSSDSPPQEPKRKELYLSIAFSDATFWEELSQQKMLVSTPGEFTQLWDEVSRPHNSLEDFILEIFDVPNRLRRNTKSLGEMILRNPVWNIISATTLENFRSKLSQTSRGSGFLQRILPVCALEKQKHLSLLSLAPATGEKSEIIEQAVLQIADLRLMDEDPKKMDIDDNARDLYNEWSPEYNRKALELEKQISDFPGFASRLEAYAIKFAIVFELMDNPKSLMVSLKSMKAAINMVEWYTKNTLYMLENNYIFDASYADRLKIRELLRKAPDRSISRSELMTNSNFSKSRLDQALDSDIDAGYIELVKINSGGSRPLRIYKLIKDKSEKNQQ